MTVGRLDQNSIANSQRGVRTIAPKVCSRVFWRLQDRWFKYLLYGGDASFGSTTRTSRSANGIVVPNARVWPDLTCSGISAAQSATPAFATGDTPSFRAPMGAGGASNATRHRRRQSGATSTSGVRLVGSQIGRATGPIHRSDILGQVAVVAPFGCNLACSLTPPFASASRTCAGAGTFHCCRNPGKACDVSIVHRFYLCTVMVPSEAVLFTAGSYMHSALTGGKRNVPRETTRTA